MCVCVCVCVCVCACARSIEYFPRLPSVPGQLVVHEDAPPLSRPSVDLSWMREAAIAAGVDPSPQPIDPYLHVPAGAPDFSAIMLTLPGGESLRIWVHAPVWDKCKNHHVPGRDGTNRGPSQLAIVAHPFVAQGAGSTATPSAESAESEPPTATSDSKAIARLRARAASTPLMSRLVGAGYCVIAFEAHELAAEWVDSGAAAVDRLVSVLSFASMHRIFKYCRIALFAQGVAATAAFVAMVRAPSLFEHRVKCLMATQPVDLETAIAGGPAAAPPSSGATMVESTSAKALETLRPTSLEALVCKCCVPVLLVHAAGPAAASLKASSDRQSDGLASSCNEHLVTLRIEKALPQRIPRVVVSADADVRLYGRHRRFDGARVLAGGALRPVLNFLSTHVSMRSAMAPPGQSPAVTPRGWTPAMASSPRSTAGWTPRGHNVGGMVGGLGERAFA